MTVCNLHFEEECFERDIGIFACIFTCPYMILGSLLKDFDKTTHKFL